MGGDNTTLLGNFLNEYTVPHAVPDSQGELNKQQLIIWIFLNLGKVWLVRLSCTEQSKLLIFYFLFLSSVFPLLERKNVGSVLTVVETLQSKGQQSFVTNGPLWGAVPGVAGCRPRTSAVITLPSTGCDPRLCWPSPAAQDLGLGRLVPKTY